MDIKDIIKWFIPCAMFLLSLLLTETEGFTADEILVKDMTHTMNEWTARVQDVTELISDYNRRHDVDFSDYLRYDEGVMTDSSVVEGRTFGRPLKKLQMALIPLAFQVGVASTWMVVSTLLSAKGVLIGAAILKLLLLAGAVKIGSLFAHKPVQHQPQTWIPQKEVHLHIHNAPQHENTHTHSYEEVHSHPSAWNRDSTASEHFLVTGNTVFTPSHALPANTMGPQTINTPYGSYVRVGPPIGGTVRRKRRYLQDRNIR